MGINPNGFTYKLNAGEELQLPEALLCYSAKGFHTMSHNFHRLIREHLCRGEYKDKRRPVLVNSWEAFIFDFDSDKLVKLARDSAKLGIEMLVIDDGWFGDRCDDDRAQCDRQEQLDYMNFYIYRLDKSCYSHLYRIKEMGCGTWVYYEPFVSVEENGKRRVLLRSGWREEITALVDGVKQAGLWDTVIGFQYDEPLLKVETDVFEEFTGFMAGFGKRQLAIFSLYEIVEGSNPSASDPEYGKEGHLINPQSCRFFTDVGFDLYHPADYDKHLNVLNEMKRRVGRDDVYIWLVPCTWSIDNRFGQEHAVNHLNMCYKLLTEQERPGGLTCYNWYSFGNKGESIDWLLDERNKSRRTNLESRMLEIANEVINTPLK